MTISFRFMSLGMLALLTSCASISDLDKVPLDRGFSYQARIPLPAALAITRGALENCGFKITRDEQIEPGLHELGGETGIEWSYGGRLARFVLKANGDHHTWFRMYSEGAYDTTNWTLTLADEAFPVIRRAIVRYHIEHPGKGE